ncbi:hypothetical protein BJX70DRAFT_404700 [Aspergillus crustosus]
MAGKKKKVSKNKCVAEPITESITEPITEPIVEPNVEPIVEPVAEPPPHDSKIDYNQPQSCPYISSNIIRIVIQGMECHIPDCYIKQYNQLKCNPFLFPPTIALDDIDGDIGHTVVHFLCTGQYETLSSAPDENSSSLDLEYRRSVQTYHAARTHGLHGLENLAIKYIRSLGESISIFQILRVAKTVFSKLPKDETWFRDYLQQNLQDALMHDKNLFKKDELHAAIGGDPILYEALMKMMVDIYNIRLMYERFLVSNSAVKVLAVDEKEAEEVPLEAQSVSERLTTESCPLEEYPLNDVVRGVFQPGKERKPDTAKTSCDNTPEAPPEESSVNADANRFGYARNRPFYSTLPTYDYTTLQSYRVPSSRSDS